MSSMEKDEEKGDGAGECRACSREYNVELIEGEVSDQWLGRV